MAPAFSFGDDEDAGVDGPRPGRRLSAIPGGAPGQATSRMPSALVVEDDPSMRILVVTNLELDGFFPAQWDPKLGIHVT